MENGRLSVCIYVCVCVHVCMSVADLSLLASAEHVRGWLRYLQLLHQQQLQDWKEQLEGVLNI